MDIGNQIFNISAEFVFGEIRIKKSSMFLVNSVWSQSQAQQQQGYSPQIDNSDKMKDYLLDDMEIAMKVNYNTSCPFAVCIVFLVRGISFKTLNLKPRMPQVTTAFRANSHVYFRLIILPYSMGNHIYLFEQFFQF